MLFVIDPDGTVRSAEEASEPPFPSAKATACVLARFRALRFPRVNGGGSVTVKYPFIFKVN